MLTTAQLHSEVEFLPEKYQQHLANYIDLLLAEMVFSDNQEPAISQKR